MTARASLVVLLTFGLASASLAVPPASPFPAAVTPADGAELPRGGSLWVYGRDEIVVTAVGVSIFVAGQAGEAEVELVGCCTLRLTPSLLPSDEGEELSLLVTSAGGELAATLTVAPPSDVAPTVGLPELVEVARVDRVLPPLTAPRETAGWIVTLDVPDVGASAVALVPRIEGGDLLGVEPPAGATFERVQAGVTGEREGVCLTVDVYAAGGAAGTSEPVCVELPQEPTDREPEGGLGCRSTGGDASVLALAAFALAFVRRRRPAATLVGAALVTGACAPASPLCEDAFDDHLWPAAELTDATFTERAAPQYGWPEAIKLLVLDLLDEERRRVAFYDEDFYELHDEWMTFRLMNGEPACGAPDVAPLESSPGFSSMAEIALWAETQERLPPFLSWERERLYAHHFYRLSREVEPRVYAPAYLTRGVAGDDFVLRVGPRDYLELAHVEAYFDAVEPLLPEGRSLYWRPANDDAQAALAAEMIDSGHPLAERVLPRT